MLRPIPAVLLAASCAALLPCPEGRSDDKKSGSWFTPALLKKGLSLIPRVGLINADIDFRPTANLDFRPSLNIATGPISLFGPAVVNNGPSRSEYDELDRQRRDVDQRLAEERNQIEREKLKVLQRQLEVQIEQARIARENLDHAKGVFEYQKERDESLLRRLRYPLEPDRLVVVVADFSDGGTHEGAEVADEIANALAELRARCAVPFEILVGEIRPGVVIRSEHLARDLGKHLPKGTCYAVVWGTLSPRTVGKFRPHVTCVMKTSEDRGVSTTYTIDLAAQDLPPRNGDEAGRRARHEELVAFTCAVIPGCYAAYELSRERAPDFSRLTEYLGKGSPESTRLEASLAPLRKWPDARKGRFEHLTRMSRVGPGAVVVDGRPVEADAEYPQVVLNSRDGSVMTLITEPGGYRPVLFDDPAGKGKYIAYIDTTETTWRQYIPFYNGTPVKDRATGGVPWLKFEGDFRNTELGPDGNPPNGELKTLTPEDLRRPVFNVTYHGAAAYCRKAGKELPRKVEWQAAARGAGTKYPWGDEFQDPVRLCGNKASAVGPFPTHPVGGFARSDRSGIGCVDMAGNVAEWCEEYDDTANLRRRVCGGSFNDGSPEAFEIGRHRNESPAAAQRWLGFRGVVRVPVPSGP
ncbi:MAG TPA: SUMF1/EgtB/PvdO family nonheme iron enzyme [Urbifossiella sp.]|nr:SUMF1/EgtB/PvdO family nonheme iron enzyme [Urbifossiella sp.]